MASLNVTPEQQGAVEQATNSDSVQKCRFIVVIDPGHGDRNQRTGGAVDPGALGGPNMEIKEKDMALDVAKAFKQKLEAKTDVIEAVYLTREGDVGDASWPYLTWRVDFAVEKQAQIFVSLHMNSACSCPRNAKGACIVPKGGHIVNTQANGKEVWCWTGAAQSKSLATSIMAAYTLPLKRRGQTGVFEKKFGVLRLRGSLKASALIEMGFIPNDNDRNTITNQKDTVAQQFTDGVVNYIIANRAALCGSGSETTKLPENPPIPRPRPANL